MSLKAVVESPIRLQQDAQAEAKLVGSTPLFQDAIRNLPLIARNDATILITGETGTGKEVVARAIHHLPLGHVSLSFRSIADRCRNHSLRRICSDTNVVHSRTHISIALD